MTRDELAKRLAEADRIVSILRRATLDMDKLGRHVLAERRREPRRPGVALSAEGAPDTSLGRSPRNLRSPNDQGL
jgi:hypothetical protein